MTRKLSWMLIAAALLLVVGIWVRPPVSQADPNGEGEEEGEHAHVPAPLEYADAHMPLSVWTDPKMIARGKDIYTVKCAICHGDSGDGKGPAGAALPLHPPDLRNKAAIAEMRDNYWVWRVSEGGLVDPFKSKGSAMPPWKADLSMEERWAVIAYQHTFSGHQGPHVPWEHPEMVQVGRDIFAMACIPCHGAGGAGDGSVAATLSPRRAPQPRNFTSEAFKFRSTPSGALPTSADLLRTVTEGVPAAGGPLTFGLRSHRIMPSFRPMPIEQRLELIEYVKSLNRGFWDRGEIRTVAILEPPPVTPERLARGKQLYADAECLACHGERGRGDGPSAPTLKDSRGLPIAATDLTKPSRFKAGSTPIDVYRTLMTGLAGTPMPSYGDALEPDQAWDLVYYVLSLGGGRPEPAAQRAKAMNTPKRSE